MLTYDLNRSDIDLSELSAGRTTVVKLKAGRRAYLAEIEKSEHEASISLYTLPPRGADPEDWMLEPGALIASVHGVCGIAPLGRGFLEDFRRIADAQRTIDAWQRFVRFD